jgi:hypothetical protein
VSGTVARAYNGTDELKIVKTLPVVIRIDLLIDEKFFKTVNVSCCILTSLIWYETIITNIISKDIKTARAQFTYFAVWL